MVISYIHLICWCMKSAFYECQQTWYSLMVVMVGETSSGSCPAPTMLLGHSEALKLIGVSIHLWCAATLEAGAVVATSRCRVLTMRQDVMS
jgi:hypothetical protein